MKSDDEPPTGPAKNRRILVVDDNPTIHQDFRKILGPTPAANRAVDEAEAALFSGDPEPPTAVGEVAFEIDSAFQGREGLEKVGQALREGRPYALAFVDVRMPPGWDGVETVTRLWEHDALLQVVICTAYSDYSWKEISTHLGRSDNLVILKKPFDNAEVLQLAHALTHKWSLHHQIQVRMDDLDRLVRQRTAELTTANQHLQCEMAQRAAAQEGLRLSEERFSKAFRATPIPLAILKRGCGLLEDVNGSFTELTAMDHPTLVGRPLEQLRLWRQASVWDDLVHRMDRGEQVRNEAVEMVRPNGSLRQVLLSLEPLKVGGEDRLLLIAQDVTEQRELEKQLRHSQKMDSIGQLAAGVAHDFNNLLTVIQGNVSLHVADSSLPPELADSLREVSAAAERAAGLTRQLLAFSRKQVSPAKVVAVADLIMKLEKMLRRLVGEHIELQCGCLGPLPPIVAEEAGLELVLVNLVVNARDALPDGGCIRITAELVVLDQTATLLRPDARPGRFVLLSVADTGCGIPAEILARVFEPFFTTKDVGKGTGLGLSTVYGVVQHHQGWIEVSSVPGQGTTFQVFLPVTSVADQPAPPVDAALPAENPSEPRDRQTVLLVEDEAALRILAARILDGNGYTVLPASNGKEALEIWEQSGGRIDLLLTDIVLPGGISGMSLARRLQTVRPGLPTLFSSGFNRELMEPGVTLEEGVNYLPKPYDVRTLLETVRLCLDQARAAREGSRDQAVRPAAA